MQKIVITLLCVFTFTVLSPSKVQPIDLLSENQTLECAMNLISEKNHFFLHEAVIGTFGTVIHLMKSSLKFRSEILPLTPSLPALNSFRMAINRGNLSEEIKYVSFTTKDDNRNEYLTYGKVEKIISSLRKKTKAVEVYIELLGGQKITLTSSDLYGIAVSENARQAFKHKTSKGSIPSTPKIKVGEHVLAPHSHGGFGYGKVKKFIGDQVKVDFKYSKDTELVPIQLVRPLLQAEDEVLVEIQIDDAELEFLRQNENKTSFPGARFIEDMEVSYPQSTHPNGHVFHAIIGSVGDDGMIQVRAVKYGAILYRQIHPRQIIKIQNQSLTF